jgi:hypothetical protein
MAIGGLVALSDRRYRFFARRSTVVEGAQARA